MVSRSRLAVLWGATMALSALLLLLLSGCSAQGGYPQKAVEVVVSFAPGGGSDVVARVWTKYFGEELKQPFNVVNRAGGNQIPAIQSVLDAPKDGYTLLQEQQANSAIKATLTDLPFKLEDRTYGPLLLGGPNAIVVNGQSPWNSLQDMVDAAKQDPASFTWVRTGGSSFTDMVTLQLFDVAGIDAKSSKPVDFEGVGPGNTAVAGGHVMMGGGGAGSVVSLVQSGDLKCLAVTGDKRVSALPDCPSAAEAGFPQSNLVNWYGISGPVDISQDAMNVLDATAKKIADNPQYMADLETVASYPQYMPPADAREFILNEADVYRRLAAQFAP